MTSRHLNGSSEYYFYYLFYNICRGTLNRVLLKNVFAIYSSQLSSWAHVDSYDPWIPLCCLSWEWEGCISLMKTSESGSLPLKGNWSVSGETQASDGINKEDTELCERRGTHHKTAIIYPLPDSWSQMNRFKSQFSYYWLSYSNTVSFL